MDERPGCKNFDGPQGSENQIGLTDVNFQCGGAGHHRGNKITRRWGVDKCIIMTDSLSNFMAQEETFTRGNSKKMVLKDLMAEEGSNLKLMWVSAHVGIKGNKTPDKAAKEVLNQKVESDWSKWMKTNGNPQETPW
jgi:hypothetical protein